MSGIIGTYEAQTAAPAYQYGVYGIFLRSEIPLPLPEHPDSALAEIDLRTAPAGWFADVTRDAEIHEFDSSWYQYARLQDRSSYARWGDVGEFLVSSDGKTIVCRQSNQASGESFRVYLLGQALSFALVKQGFEPLHATTVVVNGAAVVFLGDGGFGKSSLAACFLAAGHRILTDDLLILGETSKGILTYPGPDRIKLFPRVVRKFLGEAASGVTMNPFTRKLIVLLSCRHVCMRSVPLRAMYAIDAPREAFFELVKNTFNYRIVDGERLERQFIATERLVGAASVQKLSYPRTLDRLTAVCDAILCDLRRELNGATAGL